MWLNTFTQHPQTQHNCTQYSSHHHLLLTRSQKCKYSDIVLVGFKKKKATAPSSIRQLYRILINTKPPTPHVSHPPPPCECSVGLWVNEDRFAAWADGEHWSACWQVAYSLLSELALSHTQRDTHTHKNTYAHTLQQLWALIGTQKGLMERDGERKRQIWKRKWTSKTKTSWSTIYLQSSEGKNLHLMLNFTGRGKKWNKQTCELLCEVLVCTPEILRQQQQQRPCCRWQLSWNHRYLSACWSVKQLF